MWISIESAVPWLPRAEPYFLSSVDQDRLVSDLRSSGFDVRILGGRVTSEPELHESLAEALSFPDYYGKNWDAFRDCLSDLPQGGQTSIALIWPDAHELANESLHSFVRSVHFMLSEADGLALRDQFQLEFFFVGEGLTGERTR